MYRTVRGPKQNHRMGPSCCWYRLVIGRITHVLATIAPQGCLTKAQADVVFVIAVERGTREPSGQSSEYNPTSSGLLN